MGSRLGFEILPVESVEKAVAGCNLVLSAYRAGTVPILQGEWIEPGAHISAISAVRPEARELPTDVWKRSAVVVVDDKEHVLTCGDGRAVMETDSAEPSRWTELWEIVCRKRPGRTNPNAITLFKSVGNALQDLAIAAAVFKKATQSGVGTEIGEFPHVRT
jgi:ornithine cyclodeaminase/alanine dehydrogenase-like protein (mu-crystallin family)